MGLTRKLPLLICLLYIVVAALYSILIPLYEPQDEDYHFAFIQHVMLTGELPVQDPAIKQPWKQEGSQAPLYYWLGSAVARLVPGSGKPYELALNPHTVVGVR